MYCSKCGKKLENNSKLCNACGVSLESKTGRKSSSNQYLLAGMSVLIITMIFIVVLWSESKKSDAVEMADVVEKADMVEKAGVVEETDVGDVISFGDYNWIVLATYGDGTALIIT